ncbi:DDE_superfamily endonuclease domain-containing protein [Hexamita inflata]|uniref:DDE superfamily endonuclease domain-containing protein n=1 Tax=Hexamita inflata TaxID=28002 RepID=A0AA86P2L3_9EUKA|nr:DDE superfamily endonuclease domain-containing protein [Hexamita inflata]
MQSHIQINRLQTQQQVDNFVANAPEPEVIQPVQMVNDLQVDSTINPLLQYQNMLLDQESSDEVQGEVPTKEKRHCLNYKQWQLDLLWDLFEESRNTVSQMTNADFASQTGISKSSVKRLKTLFNKETDFRKRQTRGRKSKLDDDTLKFLSQNITQLGNLRNLTKAVNQHRELMYLQVAGVEAPQDNEEQLQALVQEYIRQDVHVQQSLYLGKSIGAALHNKLLLKTIGEKPFSFVRNVDRDKVANDPDHKDLRVANITRWAEILNTAPLELYVDESHWNLSDLCLYSWTHTNKQAIRYFRNVNMLVSVITAMSANGKCYTQVVIGSVTAQVFLTFMRYVLKWVPIQEGQCAIYLDNAGIHHQGVEELVTRCGHILHYAPTYSCALNPIEYFFGFWKGKVQSIKPIDGEGSLKQLLRLICEAFTGISLQEIRKTVLKVKRDIFPKVYRKEDL